jgi:hypothetical protein
MEAFFAFRLKNKLSLLHGYDTPEIVGTLEDNPLSVG